MIVITGLDGSGKTTFLQKLEAKMPAKGAILRMPTLDAHLFAGDLILHEMCLLVNELGQRADEKKQPSLKILAMFGAVLVHKDLYMHLLKNGAETVFCERHPLLDTPVYARAYYSVIHPDLLDEQVALGLEGKYPLAVKGFIERIKTTVVGVHKSGLKNILATLHEWFGQPENFESHRLHHLFELQNPKYVYFLDAPTDVLVSRLAAREVLEFHETHTQLQKMRGLFVRTLSNSNLPYRIVNSADFKEVDELETILLSGIER